MDEDDAKYCSDEKEHFELNSDSLTHLLKQQLTVVRSTLSAVNESSSDVAYSENKMRDGLKQLQHYVESMVLQYGNATNYFSTKITQENHIARVLDGLNVTQRHLDIVISSRVSA